MISESDLASQQRRNLLILRLAIYTTCLTSIAFPALYQPLMERIWTYLKNDRLYTVSCPPFLKQSTALLTMLSRVCGRPF